MKTNLYLGQPGTAAAAVYTSTSIRTTVFAASVCNPSATPATLDIHLVASGATATAANQIYDSVSVGPGETKGLQALINLTMEKDSALFTVASADAALTLSLSGDKHP